MTTRKTTSAKPSMTDPVPNLLPLVNVINEEKEKFAERVKVDKFRAEVRAILDRRVEEVIKQFLGFRKDRWGGQWEVDNCNGRNGESLAGVGLRNAAANLIEDWLVDHHDEMKEHIEKAMSSAVRKWVRETSGYHVRKTVSSYMENLLKTELEKHFEDNSISVLAEFLKIEQ